HSAWAHPPWIPNGYPTGHAVRSALFGCGRRVGCSWWASVDSRDYVGVQAQVEDGVFAACAGATERDFSARERASPLQVNLDRFGFVFEDDGLLGRRT